ncbi:MAG: imidazoleglycerol-phosphate dehydratase HisB [Deltaproteobacteria bacterium]|nr:MAG: imidazoleglycerol-phosphate dehydratase HisB [Deltaproteobacteria bacterium]
MEPIKIERKTLETEIFLKINPQGEGIFKIETGIPFFDHLLSQIPRHGYFDMDLFAEGDIKVDFHHTVEDVGIVFGMALKKIRDTHKKIKRYGSATIPMDETLMSVAIDLSGRSYLVYNVNAPVERIKDFDFELVETFFQGVVSHGMINLHINQHYGRNGHHIAESMFKAFGRALDEALTIEPRASEPPSTKGIL